MENTHNPLITILAELNLRGITEKECLLRAGVNTSLLTDWKKGRFKYPSYDKMVKIAQYLDISLDYLLTGIEPPPKELTEDQHELLKLYDALTEVQKAEIRGYLRGMSSK